MAVLTMARSFPVSRERVFAFLTKADNLLQWWGPEGTRIDDHKLDFSKRGTWSATMISPQGHVHTVGGEVASVVDGKMVALSLSFAMDDGGRGPESMIVFDLTQNADGGTQFVLTQCGLEAEHIADMRDKGWASALGRFENLIRAN